MHSMTVLVSVFTSNGRGLLALFSINIEYSKQSLHPEAGAGEHRGDAWRLTPSTPAVPNCCCLKGSAPYWFDPPFLISDIRALWRSVVSARAPECQKLKMVG